MKYRVQQGLDVPGGLIWFTKVEHRRGDKAIRAFKYHLAEHTEGWHLRWQAKPAWWCPWLTQEQKHGEWKPTNKGEPAMSVKVEKIEPKPEPTRKYRLTFDDGAVYSKAVHDVTEVTAREIYEGLAVHFGTARDSYAHAEIARLRGELLQEFKTTAEKDAEIARLTATLEDNRKNAAYHYDRAETIRRRNHEQVEEIRRLKAEGVVLREKCPATGVCRWYAEATELRKWLEKIKKHETTACACCDNLEDPTTAGIWAGHALAGEKVPN